MTHETLSILVMLNNFFHDLAVGILFANVALSLFLVRLLHQYEVKNTQMFSHFVRLSSRVTWGALVFIIVGGVIRTITYKNFEWAEAAGKGQVTALIAKHFLLVGCTIIGVWLQIRLHRNHRGSNQGWKRVEG